MYAALRPFLISLTACVALAGLGPVEAHAKASTRKVKKPIQVFVNAVRYGKDKKALEYVDGPAQGAFLLGDAWSEGTPAQQKKFIALFHVLFKRLAFPKLKDNLQKIETILYGKPSEAGGFTEITSTLVVLHPMKKQEVKVTYRLSKTKGKYRLVDVTFEGDASLLTNIRKDQIQPLLKDGGWDGLLTQLEARVKEIENK